MAVRSVSLSSFSNSGVTSGIVEQFNKLPVVVDISRTGGGSGQASFNLVTDIPFDEVTAVADGGSSGQTGDIVLSYPLIYKIVFSSGITQTTTLSGSNKVTTITATSTNDETISFELETIDAANYIPVSASASYSVQYIVVAGGGGAGNGAGGGGGYLSNVPGESSGGNTPALSPFIVTTPSPSLTITVGGGGGGGGWTGGTNGNPSVFHTNSASGGGGGGGSDGSGTGPGDPGGSGGGGANTWGRNFGGGAGVAGQGFPGGSGGGSQAGGPTGGGGGAGGAGTPAQNSRPGFAGNAGAGVETKITGSGVTLAGGGGGGGQPGGQSTAGGGYGKYTTRGDNNQAGQANTGGGGGGAPWPAGGQGGGSGVIILKYPSYGIATFSSGVTHSTKTIGFYKVTTITATSTTQETVTFTQ